MKFTQVLMMFSLCSTSITALQAQTLQGCEAKRQHIETQLQYAKNANNTGRVQGLQRALDNNMQYCTDHNLYDKRQQKVEKKAEKVAKLQQELQQQKTRGNSNKIAQKEKKLAQAQAELKQAQQQLKQ